METGQLWKQCLSEEIYQAKQQGILVQVDGVYYDEHNVTELPLLRETESYMKDYIGDDVGRIKEILFDKIKL